MVSTVWQDLCLKCCECGCTRECLLLPVMHAGDCVPGYCMRSSSHCVCMPVSPLFPAVNPPAWQWAGVLLSLETISQTLVLYTMYMKRLVFNCYTMPGCAHPAGNVVNRC
jgi:hypothetical protein